VLFGSLGVVWAFLFYNWFRDRPRDHPDVNAAEKELLAASESNYIAHGSVPWQKLVSLVYNWFRDRPRDRPDVNAAEKELPAASESNYIAHGSVPWQKLVSYRTVWLLWGQYFCMSYGWYFYITWMPTYLKQSFPHLTEMQRTLLNCIPLFFGGLGSIFCGLISNPIAHWLGSVARARRACGFFGLLGAAVMLVISIQFKNPLLAVLSVGMASFCNDLAMPGAWGACMDVGGKFAGLLSGSMNMMGNAGGALAPMIVPYVLKAAGGNWNANFWMFAAVYAMGALCWLFIDPVTPLQDPDRETSRLAAA
jgi:nitrate/nitrite transporter NarK